VNKKENSEKARLEFASGGASGQGSGAKRPEGLEDPLITSSFSNPLITWLGGKREIRRNKLIEEGASLGGAPV